jgi:hypothetical protein
MKLKLCFDDDSFDVCLFENKTISKWFQHFKQINSSNNYTAVNVSLVSMTSEYNVASWKNIQDTMKKLKSIGFQVPDVTADFDRDQKTLNFLHRFFTFNVLWYYKQEHNPDTPNPYDRNFKIPEDMSFQDWFDIINVINDAVHNLERFTVPHVNKKLIEDHYPLDYVLFRPNKKPHDLIPWLPFDEEDIKYNYTYFDYDHNYQLVTLNQSILGKCMLQSFYENDDPTADDCTGRLGSFGGFVVDLNNNRKSLYCSSEFKQWVESYHLDLKNLPLEFPIGYINNFETSIDANTFKHIVFID